MKSIIRYISFILLIFPVQSKTQQLSTLYFVREIHQSRIMNPAYPLNCRVYIGLPVVSSINLDLKVPLSYNELFSERTDQSNHVMDFDLVFDRLRRKNFVSVQTDIHLISLGYRYKKSSFTFDLTERLLVTAGIPRDVLFPLMGNANELFLGKASNLDGLGVNLNYYREYALGWTYEPSKYVSFGIRPKVLFGKLNLDFRRTEIKLFTDSTLDYITISSNSTIHSSLPINLEISNTGQVETFDFDNSVSLYKLVLNRENPGMALDFGMHYKPEDSPFNFYGSITDLGFIYWRTNPINIRQGGELKYSGPDEVRNVDESYFTDLLDSLQNEFLVNNTRDNYGIFLPFKIYLGTTWHITDRIFLGALSRTKYYKRTLSPSFTFSANTVIFKNLYSSVSYSYLNGSFKNVGIGMGFGTRNLQFYGLTDNALVFIPQEVRNVNIRFGMNMYFGCRPLHDVKNLGCIWIKEQDREYVMRRAELVRKGKRLKKLKKFKFFNE
ncbi:DUF5723 family protein [Bacteroidota bacterium]